MRKLFHCTDTTAECSIKLLGGERHGSVTLSHDQVRSLMMLYGFHEEESASVERAIMIRDMFRHAEHDGLRLVTLLARFCEKNEDPAKVLVRLLIDAGLDIGELYDWANEE